MQPAIQNEEQLGAEAQKAQYGECHPNTNFRPRCPWRNKMSFLFDRADLEAPCPKCGFFNSFYFRQARLQDVIICRGCKCNIRLVDHMNQCRNASRRVVDGVCRLVQRLAR